MEAASYNLDMRSVLRRISDTLNNMMRSKNLGDNLAPTTVLGKAYFQEPYIRVRWLWMILTIVETFLAASLLLVAMVATRPEPLLKSSVVALLGMPLEGWQENELLNGG